MLRALRARLHNTSGGSSETELKELTVTPWKQPSGKRTVTTVTPVANCASVRRKWSVEKSGAEAPGADESMSNLSKEKGRQPAGGGKTIVRRNAGSHLRLPQRAV